MPLVRRNHRIAGVFGLTMLIVASSSCDAFDRGDLNGDGQIDGTDIPGFIEVILDPGSATPEQLDRADIGSPEEICTADLSVDLNDVPGMVLLLMGDVCNFAPVILEGDDPLSMGVASCGACPDPPNALVLNAVDPNGDTPSLLWSISTQGSFGTASFTSAAAGGQVSICYAPMAPAAADSFTVLVEDDAGGSDAIVVNVTIDPPPVVMITQMPIADGVRLDAGAGFASYLWTPGGETTQTIDVNESGAYGVTVTDDDGCEATDTTDVMIAQPVTIYRINAGGAEYTDPDSNVWSTDAGFYNVGMTSSIDASTDILGTDLDSLYRTDRWDSSQDPEMVYSFPVGAGDYRVRLHFAETFWTVPERRIFDVAIEGTVVLADYDIVAVVGPLAADIYEFDTAVSDGMLDIEFIHNFENPKICAIEVIQLSVVATPPTVAITAPAEGEVIVGDEVTVNWQASGDLSAADHVHVQLDGGSVIMLPDLTGSHMFTNVAPGPHTVTIQLVDANQQDLANPEATDAVNFTTEAVVGGPPTIAITSPLNGANVIGTSLTVNWQSSGDLTDVDHIHVQLDSDPNQSVNDLNGSFTFIGVAEGPHTITVTMADATDQMLVNPEATDVVNVTLQLPTGGNEVVLYRVNAGGPALTDPDGNDWTSDAGLFNTGSTFSTNEPIAGTEFDALYQTERFNQSGSTQMTFSFPVDPGTYRVRLHFAEIWGGAANPGVRVFDVLVEGAVVLDNFDVAAQVGLDTALIEEIDVQVEDASLDVSFAKILQNPKVNGIEIIQLDAGEMTVSPTLVEWGNIPVGEQGFDQTLTLANPGVEPVTISSVAFLINSGVGHDFLLTLDGVDYVGDHEDITFPTSVTIPGGQSIDANVTFLPTEAEENDVWLEFHGNFPTQQVRLLGSGGDGTGHPFLHVDIVVDPVTVDFDQNGSEPVLLQGIDSHTHELGHELTAFEWREDGNLIATTPNATVDFPVGEHTVTLTIFDDNDPPEQLSLPATFRVVGPDEVPGALARYYATTPGGATALLDAVPATADFGEVLSTLDVDSPNGAIGGSPFLADAMVRLNARVDLAQAGSYEFIASGGAGTRVFVNGAASTGPVALAAGLHDIEARFAVDSLAQLPLAVTVRLDGGAATAIDPDSISHDELALPPIINTAPTVGNEAGGNPILITGLGFVPLDQVVVHWGGTDLSGAALTVTPTSIELISPPGTGTIPVTVETPSGVSNSFNFNYQPGGPTPIVFSLADVATIAKPTTLTFGPDERLYVATVQGKIAAYTLDDDGNVTATQSINTLNTVSNKAILGIAVNPYDPPSPVRLYVAHGEIFANGGACFEGVSEYSGEISVLTGPNFDVAEPFITGLPVSNHDHAINGIDFDNAGNLLVCIGGNTNAGVQHCNIGNIPESPLAAAVVKAEIWRPDFNGAVQYVERATGLVNMDQVYGDQVDLARGLDVYVLGHGLRNAYDLVYTTAGRTYATDNGPNPTFGPASTSATTQTATDPNEADELLLIEEDHYYGHPNRNRGMCDDRQNVYYDLTPPSAPGVFTQALMELAGSTDGILEYRSERFNGQMYGDLIVQKWNGATTRIELGADGKSVASSGQLNVVVDSLDIVAGPGGTIFGANYSDNKVSIARPAPTTGFAAFDITPWRAPATGGYPFVIAGTGFGTLANTSVTIGGVAATLTSVSATRIGGTIPANPNPPNALVDVVVSVGGASRTIPAAFRWLVDPRIGDGASAYLEIDPGGNLLGSSTYQPDSFKITNNATGGRKIVRVTYDFHEALLPDIVFDPTGNAGDTAFKPFQVNTDPGVGLQGHQFRCPHDGGFDRLVIRFNNFNPGQTFGFSVDVDPTSINGATPPGPNDSGSISGLELVGSRVTVVFDDGTSYRRQLFLKPGSETGSQIDTRPTALPRPVISALGVASTPANVANASQTIHVTGPAGANVRLLVVDGALYVAGVPNGGFDLDPFEANTARSVTEYNATVGAGGTVDIPVTLTKFDADAGINHIVAAFSDAQGRTSDTSNVIVLDFN